MGGSGSQTAKFGFMFDDRFRRLVSRDYGELSQLDSVTTPKAVMVLSGSVIEGVLSDAILATGYLSFSQIQNCNFSRLIEDAKKLRILTKTELSTVLRGYRNLVHPGVEIRERIEFDDADANVSMFAVEVIIREVAKWAKYFKVLSSLTAAELEVLAMFGTSRPKNSPFEHPWLEVPVYRATESLQKKDILVVDPENHGKTTTTQRILIAHEAERYVEQIVLKNPFIRTEITLDFSNIAAPGVSGSGATGSYHA